MIIPYRGYGSRERIYLKGRVLQDRGIRPPADNDTVWRNLVNTYRRLDSHEIPGARVRARFASAEQEVLADDEGYFEVDSQIALPPGVRRLWHRVELELLWPLEAKQRPVRAIGEVLIPPPTARFVVISDIDDTVLQTDATSILRMARNVFLRNARTRLPFPGVAAFYRALHYGAHGNELNPLFYVSSSPWNIYDLLSDFFALREIPVGPVLFLRDWGLTRDEILPLDNRTYKLAVIRKILDFYPDLPVILVGDSGQQDPEIYEEIAHGYAGRILAVYIRNVSRKPQRWHAIEALAQEVTAAGSTLILADNTLPMAEHAAAHGWIAQTALSAIAAEKEFDSAPAGPLEILLGQSEQAEGPTVVVEPAGAVEAQVPVEEEVVGAALQAGDEETKLPPTVVVRGSQTSDTS
jgi:phosphatidate phosphatase APP1